MAGRPRLFPRSAALRPRTGGGFSGGDNASIGGGELSRHDQGISLSPASDRLLDAGSGAAAGGSGGSASGLGYVRRPEYALYGHAAAVADFDSTGRRAWLQGHWNRPGAFGIHDRPVLRSRRRGAA